MVYTSFTEGQRQKIANRERYLKKETKLGYLMFQKMNPSFLEKGIRVKTLEDPSSNMQFVELTRHHPNPPM